MVRNDKLSTNLKHAINAAVAKLTEYYCKLSNKGLLIAVVLDPGYKLQVYAKTQDPVRLRAAASAAIHEVIQEYKSLVDSLQSTQDVGPPARNKSRWTDDDYEEPISELDKYLQEPRDYETEVLTF